MKIADLHIVAYPFPISKAIPKGIRRGVVGLFAGRGLGTIKSWAEIPIVSWAVCWSDCQWIWAEVKNRLQNLFIWANLNLHIVFFISNVDDRYDCLLRLLKYFEFKELIFTRWLFTAN